MQYSLGIEMHPKGQDVARYASIQLKYWLTSEFHLVKMLEYWDRKSYYLLTRNLTVFGEITLYTVMGCCKTLKSYFSILVSHALLVTCYFLGKVTDVLE